MLKSEIERLRKALNSAIKENKDYDVIYNLSTQLDELIVDYYKKVGLKVS